MLSDGDFVRHKTEGYEGKIDGTTSLKELFTGNTDCSSQYRVHVFGEDARRVAPAQDLTILSPREVKAGLARPRMLATDTKFREMSFLKEAGYDLETSFEYRKKVLSAVVAEQGLYKVVSFLVRSLMYNRTGNPDRVRSHYRSLSEWGRDVDWLMDNFRAHEEYARTENMLRNAVRELRNRGYKWPSAGPS